MNNIESIKEDYNIGDPIRIVCSLGIKEGYIVDFREDRIKIRPFEEGRKPISISEENIKDYEEAAPPSGLTNSSSDSFVKPYTENNPQINSDSKIIKENEKTIPQTDQAPSAGTHPIQEQQESTSSDGGFIKKDNQPSFVLGYVDLQFIVKRDSYPPYTGNKSSVNSVVSWSNYKFEKTEK